MDILKYNSEIFHERLGIFALTSAIPDDNPEMGRKVLELFREIPEMDRDHLELFREILDMGREVLE